MGVWYKIKARCRQDWKVRYVLYKWKRYICRKQCWETKEDCQWYIDNILKSTDFHYNRPPWDLSYYYV
jgi:hypothetical protein